MAASVSMFFDLQWDPALSSCMSASAFASIPIRVTQRQALVANISIIKNLAKWLTQNDLLIFTCNQSVFICVRVHVQWAIFLLTNGLHAVLHVLSNSNNCSSPRCIMWNEKARHVHPKPADTDVRSLRENKMARSPTSRQGSKWPQTQAPSDWGHAIATWNGQTPCLEELTSRHFIQPTEFWPLGSWEEMDFENLYTKEEQEISQLRPGPLQGNLVIIPWSTWRAAQFDTR